MSSCGDYKCLYLQGGMLFTNHGTMPKCMGDVYHVCLQRGGERTGTALSAADPTATATCGDVGLQSQMAPQSNWYTS